MKKNFLLILVLLFVGALMGVAETVSAATPVSPAAVTPTVDGVVSPGEWDDAGSFTINQGTLMVKHDARYVYFLLDVTSETTNDGTNDYFWFTFDVNENGVIDSYVDLLYGTWPGTYNMGLTYHTGGGTTTGLNPTNSAAAAGFGTSINSAANHRIWEFAFDRAEIVAPADTQIRVGIRTAINPTAETPSNPNSDFTNLIQINLDFPISPTIDGVISPGEWDNAESITIGQGNLMVKHDAQSVYFLLDVTADTTDGGTDYYWFTFDVDTDKSIDPNVDLNYGNVFDLSDIWKQYYLGPGAWTPVMATTSNAQAGFSSSINSTMAHRFWEIAFDRAEISAPTDNMVSVGIRTGYSPDIATPAVFWNNFTNLIQIYLTCSNWGGDADGDGVCGDEDNCPAVSNPDQTDTNLNGIGNACEFTVSTSVSGNGTINPSSSTSTGSPVEFSLFPDPGYYLVSVSGCGGTLTGNIFTTGSITAPCTVTATFAPCSYTVPLTPFTFDENGGNGSFSVTTNPQTCPWFITFPLGWVGLGLPDRIGDSTVNFTVVPNPSNIPRSGSIDIKRATLSGPTVASVSVTQAGRPCNYAINPYKTVLPSSGVTDFKVSVMAFADNCQWSVANIPGWIQNVSPTSGTGNGVVTFSAAANNNIGARTVTMTIAGQPFFVEQRGNALQETLVLPASGDTWVTATITNNTGQPLVTAKPTCCNTYFWITDSSGNMVPPIDRVCEPVGIPDSLVSIAAGGSFEIRCDLSEVALLPPQGTVNVMATYVNPLTFDPHYDSGTGGCVANDIGRTACFDLKAVVIPSGTAQLDNIGAGASAQKVLAALAFDPGQWDVQWATVNGPAIIAQISGLTCTSVNLPSIKMNGQAGILPGSCQDTTGGILVKLNRSAAVQSLGSIVPGMTAAVTIQGSFASGENIFYGQGTVDIVKDTGTLVVQANLHSVGIGSQPPVKKALIPGMEVRVYDKKQGSCAAGYGVSWQKYPAIWNGCKEVASDTTDAYNGQAIFALPQGDYLVIGQYGSIYPGVSVGIIDKGSIVFKYLQIIQDAYANVLPAKYQKFTGSELLLIEPEYVEWSGTQELYPFILESSGDWTVTTAVTPPEGFVADHPSLSTDVNSELTALQFTVTDVGSKWVSTGVDHNIKHKGKTIKVKSKIGMKLSPGLQKKLGLGEFGEEE